MTFVMDASANCIMSVLVSHCSFMLTLIMFLPGLCWQTLRPITRTHPCLILKRTTLFCTISLPTWRLLAFTILSTRFEQKGHLFPHNQLVLFWFHLNRNESFQWRPQMQAVFCFLWLYISRCSCSDSFCSTYASHRSTSLQSASRTSPSSTSSLLLLSCLNFNTTKTKVIFFPH